MITGIYFLLLLLMSAEDVRSHTVKPVWVVAVYLLGIIEIIIYKESRWVTLALTCVCFVLLFLFYILVKKSARRRELSCSFGGADVRLIPGMMLVQGWEAALTGVCTGLVLAALVYFLKKQKEREIPLVPWMSAGCLLVEIIYLFS